MRASVIPACSLIVFLSVVFLLPSGFPAHAATEGTFGYEIISLQQPGVMSLAAHGDVNGDGEADLLLFHKASRESYEKICSLYFQRNGKIEPKPDVQIRLAEGVGAVQIKDIDSDGKDELCVFDSKGLMQFKLINGMSEESKRLIEHQTILPLRSRQLALVSWVADLTSDGRMDVLLPLPNGMRLFERKENSSFIDTLTFEFPVNGSVREEGGQDYVSYRVPKIECSDFDKDGHADLGAFDFERMDYFLTNGSDAPRRHVTAPLLRKFTKDFIAAADYDDLNGDGIADAVLVLMSQKKNLQSEIQIYFGSPEFSYGGQPAQVYSADASLILPVFYDALGDGKKEMLLEDINVGIGFFLNYFLGNRIRVDIELRKLSPEGRYEQKPLVKRALYISVSESGGEPARGVGDFNGDGLEDLVVGTSEKRLSFFLSNKQEILPREPDYGFNVPAYGSMSIFNLNSDKRTDLIILYTEKGKEGLATLVLSR